IVAAIERCGHRTAPCEITYAGLGTFPPRRPPRVVWLGAEETTGTLHSLKKRIDHELIPLGFKPEERPFHPHVTLGRLRSDQGIRNLISKLENIMFEPQTAELGEIQLMKSDLQPGGSVYSVLHSTQLRAAENNDDDER